MVAISIHAPLAGCDSCNPRCPPRSRTFQSTHPLRGATYPSRQPSFGITISIHAPLAGCDVPPNSTAGSVLYFNPRTPCGVRPAFWRLYRRSSRFQSTHPLRGATRHKQPVNGIPRHFNPRTPCGVRPSNSCLTHRLLRISIHAPLAGCDDAAAVFWCGRGISIHAPLAGCDFCGCANSGGGTYFNPRTPCGVRPVICGKLPFLVAISIHAPLAGCDSCNPRCPPRSRTFQSTHPLRGATYPSRQPSFGITISIHAPLAGCDVPPNSTAGSVLYFNPRTPCGVRPAFWRLYRRSSRFQSTHPLRGATRHKQPVNGIPRHFNPRTPCGVRPSNSCLTHRLLRISIHAPLAGCDDAAAVFWCGRGISIHAPLAGCDFCGCANSGGGTYFNPRTPCGVRPLTMRGGIKQK